MSTPLPQRLALARTLPGFPTQVGPFRIRNKQDLKHTFWLMRLSYIRYATKASPDPRRFFKQENEAAGAADAAAWVMSAVLIFGSDNLWSQGGVPVTHLRKMMLEELQRRHYFEAQDASVYRVHKAPQLRSTRESEPNTLPVNLETAWSPQSPPPKNEP